VVSASKSLPAFLPWHRKSCHPSGRSQLNGYSGHCSIKRQIATIESLTPRVLAWLECNAPCSTLGLARRLDSGWAMAASGPSATSWKVSAGAQRQHDHPRPKACERHAVIEITGAGGHSRREAECMPQRSLGLGWGPHPAKIAGSISLQVEAQPRKLKAYEAAMSGKALKRHRVSGLVIRSAASKRLHRLGGPEAQGRPGKASIPATKHRVPGGQGKRISKQVSRGHGDGGAVLGCGLTHRPRSWSVAPQGLRKGRLGSPLARLWGRAQRSARTPERPRCPPHACFWVPVLRHTWPPRTAHPLRFHRLELPAERCLEGSAMDRPVR